MFPRWTLTRHWSYPHSKLSDSHAEGNLRAMSYIGRVWRFLSVSSNSTQVDPPPFPPHSHTLKKILNFPWRLDPLYSQRWVNKLHGCACSDIYCMCRLAESQIKPWDKMKTSNKGWYNFLSYGKILKHESKFLLFSLFWHFPGSSMRSEFRTICLDLILATPQFSLSLVIRQRFYSNWEVCLS